jgi:hypothetical protein
MHICVVPLHALHYAAFAALGVHMMLEQLYKSLVFMRSFAWGGSMLSVASASCSHQR